MRLAKHSKIKFHDNYKSTNDTLINREYFVKIVYIYVTEGRKWTNCGIGNLGEILVASNKLILSE